MTLRKLFAIPVAVILFVTLLLAGMIVHQGLTDHAHGRVAIETVDRMRLLVTLQANLWAERVASVTAIAGPHPMPEAAAQRLADTRTDTDRAIEKMLAHLQGDGAAVEGRPVFPGKFPVELAAAREAVDHLAAQNRADRSEASAAAAMARMLSLLRMLEKPLALAMSDVTAADAGLADLLAVARLTSALRDTVTQIAALVVPGFVAAEPFGPGELDRVHVLLAEASQLVRLLDSMVEDAKLPQPVREALSGLDRADDLAMRLDASVASRLHGTAGGYDLASAQQTIGPLGQRLNTLRLAIVDAAQERVLARQANLERRLGLVLVALGSVLIAIAKSIALLRCRVVAPLALLGTAITRIANGERRIPLDLTFGTAEIQEMVVAVEALRQAALIADASNNRRREAEQRRLEALREALSIARTVREPARALESSIACICEGIDAVIGLVPQPPAALTTAANAAHLGLAEMRGTSAAFEATIAAAHLAQSDAQEEADIVAHILAVRDQVERRDAAVRGLIQPSLAALRDIRSVEGPVELWDLVSDQFERIEATVVTVASMRFSMARVGTILRDLSLETLPDAA